eukprot:SAG31_NODE_7294_length_1729_cov_1.662577_1_plen_106_part_10
MLHSLFFVMLNSKKHSGARGRVVGQNNGYVQVELGTKRITSKKRDTVEDVSHRDQKKMANQEDSDTEEQRTAVPVDEAPSGLTTDGESEESDDESEESDDAPEPVP